METESHVPVARLGRGDIVDLWLLVENANFKQNRAGKPFLQLTLRDRTGRIRALHWETDRRLYETIRVNDVVHVRGRVEEYQGTRQIVIDRISVVDPSQVRWEDFLPQGPADTEKRWSQLRSEVERISNYHLRALLNSFLDDRDIAQKLKRAPAGKSLHHAFPGGLLEHIVSIIELARALVRRWPELDEDLLVAGAVLHDLGKITEIRTEKGFSYSDEGQLVGHVALGLNLLEDKLKSIADFPAELRMELQHLIVSHHGKTEYGALREPMTPEAIALHFLDNLDARLSAYFALARDEQESPYGEGWTNLNPLFGTRLYRPKRLRDSGRQ